MADTDLSPTEPTPSPSVGGGAKSSEHEDTGDGNVSSDHSGCPIQEHEPLDHLLKCLPHKAQKGLFSMDLDYTCLDVSQEYVALGTSVGIVFLYDRLGLSLQKLKCQSPPEMVTCVRLRQGVDYVVAAGTAKGRVFIFQLPSFLPGRAKQLHMFCVEGLHVGEITCLEWSPNTEKLFSSDQDGNVVCTEIDYTQQQSKSFTFCQEPHPVIQLSYAHRTLLVSTTFRSVLCTRNTEKRVKRIGTKDRKILGDFGACFMPGSYKPEDAVVYCARPGLRLWRASMEGTVQTTYMFRDLLHGKTVRVPLLPDTECSPLRPGSIEEFNFGKLYVLAEKQQLVTYTGSSLFVLDPAHGRLLGWANNLGEVQGMAVCGDEIFILRRCGHRRIVRIARKRDIIIEPTGETADNVPSAKVGKPPAFSSSSSSVPPSPVHLFQHTAEMMQSGIMAALQGVTEKIQEGQQLVGTSGIPPWGSAHGPRKSASQDDADLDSCKEASSASSVSSSVHEDLLASPGSRGAGHDAGTPERSQAEPGMVGKEDPRAPQSTTAQQRLPQPEIRLESDDVISVHIPHRDDVICESGGEKTASDSSGYCSSGHGSLGNGNGPAGSKQDGGPSRSAIIEKINQVHNDDTDIVFSPKPKKQKKKKAKTHTSKRLVEDTISIDSLEVASVTSLGSVTNETSASPSPVPSASPIPNTSEEFAPPKTEAAEACVAMESVSDPMLNLKEDCDSEKQGDSVLPPVQKLADLGLGEIKITPKVQPSSSEQLQPKESVPETKGAPPVTITESTKEMQTERPQNLPAGLPNRSADSLPEPVLFGRKTSSPYRPTYEHSTSTHSPTTELDTSISNASAISASFHEDMNAASFESYASRTSGVGDPDSPSPNHEAARREFYKTPDSSDDFYSKYHNSTSNYSLDDIYSPTGAGTLEEALDYSGVPEPKPQSKPQSKYTESMKAQTEDLSVSSETDALDVHHKFSDTWTEMLAPGNLQSLCLTKRHIWVVDKSDRLHYSSLTGPGLTWRKVDEAARQIAVSWSGSIVWRLHQGSVFAGTKMTTRAPAGLSWVEVLRKDVRFIAVDESTAWYIKSNGDVMMQKGLSRDRPSFRSLKVACKLSLRQICCQDGVVWGVTESRGLVYRAGVAPGREEGTSWEKLGGENESLQVSSLAFGDGDTAWVIDMAARVWFTTGVTASHPAGTNKWWEVSISEYIMSDSVSTMTVRQMAEYPLSKLVATPTDTGGLISVGQSGVWVSRGYKHVLHVCRGSLLGHNWQVAGPSGMAQSAQWHLVSASAATKTEGLVWTQQPNGAIFSFSPTLGKATEVIQPRQDMSAFACLSAAPESVWCLTKEGNVMIRDGMAAHCQHGLSWANLDLMQLGGVQLVYLSCGEQNVWAVDVSGMVYLRIGNRPPDAKHLSPAWVPVEGTTHHQGAKFIKVFTGSLDWMVWALDSKKCIYVRKGVTDSMPIGTHWLYIPGTTAEELTLSERLVYALSPAGELLARYSVLEDNPAGDYWKRIPGHLKSISVTAGDTLWGINQEGQLCQRRTHFLKRKESEIHFSTARSTSISDDWEVI